MRNTPKRSLLRMAPVGLAAVLLAACVHTPPGTSVEVALAKKPEVVRLPAPPPPPPSENNAAMATSAEVRKVEQVADAFTRGKFCLEAGKDAEALAAFEETVKLDPTFADAWSYLAILYERTGQPKKAMEAFRQAKSVSQN